MGKGEGKGEGCCSSDDNAFATYAGDSDTDGEADAPGKLTKRGWPDRVRIKKQGRLKGAIADCPMCLLFIIFWIMLAITFKIGLDKGNPMRLIRGTDYLRNLCGEGAAPPEWDSTVGSVTNIPDLPPWQSRVWSENRMLWFPLPYTGSLEKQLYGGQIGAPALPAGTAMPTGSYGGFTSQLDNFAESATEALSQGICVKECPSRGGDWSSLGDPPDLQVAFSDPNAAFLRGLNKVYTYGEQNRSNGKTYSPNNWLFFVWYQSKGVYSRCLPAMDGDDAAAAIEQLKKAIDAVPTDYATGYLTTWANDIDNSRKVLGMCAGLALVLCALYTIILRCCLKPMICFCITVTFLLLLVGAYLCFTKYDELANDCIGSIDCTVTNNSGVIQNATVKNTDNDDESKAWLAGTAIFAGLALTFLIVMICLRKQILIACEIIIESGKVIRSDPTILFLPILTAFQVGLLLLFFIYALLYIYTIEEDDGPIVTTSGVSEAVGAPNTVFGLSTNLSVYTEGVNTTEVEEFVTKETIMWAWLFGWLWTMGLLNAIGFFVIAAVTVQWYYSHRCDDEKKAKLCRGWCRGYCWALKHIGGLVTGAFLVAVVQWLRFFVKTFTEKLEKAVGKDKAKAIMCLIDCCLAYLERVLKYITEKSYVIMAIQGSGFWCSCCDLMSIIMDNVGLMAMTDMLAEIVFVAGKLMVIAANCTICYLLLNSGWGSGWGEGVDSGFVVIFIVALLTYILASLFMHVYDSVIDAMLILVARELRMGESADTIACPAGIFKIATGKTKDNAQELDDWRKENKKVCDERTGGGNKVAPEETSKPAE